MCFCFAVSAAVLLPGRSRAYEFAKTTPAKQLECLENIAIGRPYAFSREPNYSHTKDEEDVTALTDGKLSVHVTGASFWTRKSTVGWSGRSPVAVTVDLGKVEPVRGFAFRTIGGAAGIEWPRFIAVWVSEDGENFYPAAELEPDESIDELSPDMPRWYWTDDRITGARPVRTRGRYVAFIPEFTGYFIFTDEIEVYRGHESFLDISYAGEPRSLTEAMEAFVPKNIALGAEYTLNPEPNYHLTKDPGDLKYLTDGQYTAGRFWTQKTTVGWDLRARDIIITMDLGGHYPIEGLSVSTAGGEAGVRMPSSIRMLVSADGRRFYEIGDLVELSGKKSPVPAYGEYFRHRFHTDGLKTHGRFIRLEVIPEGQFFFTDEVEVYRGEDEWKELPMPGEAIRRPREYFHLVDDRFEMRLRRRLDSDLESVRAELAAREISSGAPARFEEQIRKLDKAILELPPVEDPENFRAVFPVNDVHAGIFALLGDLRREAGYPAVLPWSANPWDNLAPMDVPAENKTGGIFVAAMRGETRAAALNLTNSTRSVFTVDLRFNGLPGGAAPDYIRVYEVAWTDTGDNTPVAAALIEAPSSGKGYEISLPAGMTRQVWFSFTPEGISPGMHSGHLSVENLPGGALRVPAALRVFDLDFPEFPALSVGGWDYTNMHYGGITPANRDRVIAYLRECFVDATWATRDVLQLGEFDSSGRYSKEPDTTRFDAWVDLWPGARRYQVYLDVYRAPSIGATEMGEPLFERKVGEWINFWVRHARSRGISPNQLFLLLVDESRSIEDDKLIAGWSRAIKAAQPEVVIWDDGTRGSERNTRELMESVDFLSPHRPAMLPGGTHHHTLDFYLEHRRAGGRLDLYSCRGPARALDPYTYYRLQAWSCFQLGAEGTQFWSFSGRGEPWNEYFGNGGYAPFFMDSDAVTPGKQMEAIRESVADYEYLSMLREAVAETERKNPLHPLLPGAREVAAGAVSRVLDAPGANRLMWAEDKDRSAADSVLLEIGELLEKLK